ncbi:TPA: hypothetical protein ACNTUM_000635 [Escherichia coli]|nr:hypothetical protein [Escherichia coli]HCO3884071.1 hypothetical protein [Escherichia coli]
MKRIRFHFNGSDYELDWVIALVLVALALFCNQLNTNDKNSRLVSDMNRQRTAAEMRAMKAEQKLASNHAPSAPGVVIIAPDSRSVQNVEPKKSYSSIQRDVVF